MSDVVYEETATMIAAGELQSFVPFGRDHCKNHPNAFNLQLRELQPASELWTSDCAAGLAGSLQEVSLQERERESWQLRKGCMEVPEQGVEFEEELYSAGNVVVWTKGSRAHGSNVYKAFTVDSPVEQALWCDFAVPQSKKDDEQVEHTVCIVQNGCINIHTVTGKDFLSPLPFQVSKAWPTKFGLVLERKITTADGQLNPPGEPLPYLFSMLHPIDEVAPVVYKPSGPFDSSRVEYMTESSTKIVFTCCQPSIIVTYDSEHGTHSVWRLRKVTSEERSTVLSCLAEPFAEPLGFQATGLLMSHLRNHSRLDTLCGSKAARFNPGAGASGANSPHHYSTVHSHQNRILMSSPVMHSRVHSPGISKMAAVSRDHSPGMAMPSLSGAARFNTTLHSSSPVGHHHGMAHSPNSTINETVPEPIIPDLCMEQLWSETTACHSLDREMSSQASKVFLTSDLCENRYLCFLVESHQQLRCVKFVESNDTSQLIFASVTNITAKDAEPLQNIDAMLVLEACGSLILYTGVTRVSQVFVPGLLPSTFGLNNNRVSLYTPQEQVSTPANANSRHLQRMDEAAMPSPVSDPRGPNVKHHEASFLEDYTYQQALRYIHALRDPVSNRVTLELSNGTMLRISIPDIAVSELVRKCLQAIRFILPKEAAMKVLVKWYTIYNAPGGTSPHSEWNLFVTCFLKLMGYNTERLTWTRNLNFEVPLSPVIAAKKARPCDGGCDEDWEYLLGSHYHRQMDSHSHAKSAASSGFNASVIPDDEDLSSASSSSCVLDNTAPLFVHIPALFYVLHLLYQELLLNELHRERASSLVCLLQQLARDLQLEDYVDLYWRDYPSLINGFTESCFIDQSLIGQMQHPSFLRAEPPCIFSWLSSCLQGEAVPPFPYLPGVCHRLRLLVLSYALYISGDDKATTSNVSEYLVKLSAGQKTSEQQYKRQTSVNQVKSCSGSLAEQLVVWLTSQGFTLKDLESVPFGVALPIRDAIYHCREQPCADWSEEVCLLIGRQDRTRQAHNMTLVKSKASVSSSLSLEPPATTEADEEEDGMSDIIQEVTGLIWSQDLRVQEVRRLLQSSKPVRVCVVQLPEVSDHEYIEEKENKLLQLCQRTMSLPVGRGLFTLFSYQPVPTELLPIPKLNLTGRAPPRNTMVNLNSGNIDVPANMPSWPSFHNGVAAGLKIAPASQVDSAWIVYNKNKNQEMANEHAGFLMALGLNGHLTKLGTLNIHDYLTKGHEMTTIGLLLGVAAARLGTMDVSTTRLLSIHIPALLPPTSTELDVPHNIQVASVIGIGLVYQGTGHRHIAEVLQSEIGRPPGPEMEYCTDRESYSLAAGLALGMVCLGQGSNLIGMSDLNVPEQLYQYMVGGHRRAPVGASRERHKSPSYQIKEGDTINVDVTCPGATLALAMIYLKTNNRSIADWLKPPDTWFLLDFIKPEFLLLRTLARCIIMWDEILPNTEWVKSNVPQIMRGSHSDSPENINMETWIQVQDYITAGACMALGLRFAGSANSDAFDCLYGFAKNFMNLMSFYGTAAAEPGCYNMQTALSMILLSMSMVMAGTGNLKVLQLCRFLHYRTGGEMNYGFHMAHHMALGMLFLGGGRFSLSTSNSAIAALLCALYPHFPSHSTDNRYHLQALRHLIVLAAESRLLVPVDVDSLNPCYALLEVTYKKTDWYDETTVELMAPTMLPELHLLKRVRVKGPRYWELSIDLIKEVQHLKSVLSRDGVLYVKLRAGQLPYKDDPQGWKSLLGSAVPQRSSGVRAFKLEAISTFTSEPALLSFAEFFCKTSGGAKHREETVELFSAMLYECVTQECPEMLPTYVAIEQAVGALCRGEPQHSFALWQMRLVVELWDSRVLQRPAHGRDALLSSEFLPVMKNKVDVVLDSWLKDNSSALRSYIGRKALPDGPGSPMLACFLVYRSVPCLRNKLAQLQGCTSLGHLLSSSSRLGMPLRDLLRLAPVLLESETRPQMLLGSPLLAR